MAPDPLELSLAELVALLAARGADLESLEEEADRELAAEGTRSLLARGVLVESGDGLVLSEGYGGLASALDGAMASIVVERSTEETVEESLYHVGPSTSVEQRATESGFLLACFDSSNLRERLVEGGEAPRGEAVAPQRVSVEALAGALSPGERGGALPAGLAEALSEIVRGISIRATRWEDGRLVGCELVLLESSNDELWLLDPLDGESGDEEVELRPIARDEVIGTVFAELPFLTA